MKLSTLFAIVLSGLAGAAGAAVYAQNQPAPMGRANLLPGFQPFNAGSYFVGGVAGVSCSGSPTAGFTTVNGIVTAC
jgi:hypothetical protein